MTEQYNEQWEQDDMDSDIRRKEELIAEMKAVTEEPGGNSQRRYNELKNQWRKVRNWESSYEEDLEVQFNTYAEQVYAGLNSEREAVKARKEDLISRAREASQTDDFKKGMETMNTLMDEWKQAGFAGRETDDQLWSQFQEARKTFYDRRRAHQKEMQKKYVEVKAIKEGLIDQARELLDPSEWNSATKKMNELMDAWKAAGYAGRDNDSALWENFNGIRKEFFSQRSAYYSGVRRQQQKSAAAKKAIIAEAEAVANSHDVSRENVDFMKSLSVRWKEAGFSGRDNEDNLWKKFRAVSDQFFNELTEVRQAQHSDWVGRMEDIIARKQQLISDQKRYIRRLEDELNGLISQGRAEEIEDTIADKESFIAELEDDIAQIERKISKD